VKSLPREAMPQLLQAGWALESAVAPESSVTAGELASLRSDLYQVDLTGITERYLDVIGKVRDLGIAFSDRRAVKVMKLLAASALLCGRRAANPSDLWVLRYVWDSEEQIEPLGALINGVLEQHAGALARHPLASAQRQPDAEELARQLDAIEKQLGGKQLSLTVAARLREQVADLADRSAWLGDVQARDFLLGRSRKLLERLG
jgi:MoxR-like ATPase